MCPAQRAPGLRCRQVDDRRLAPVGLHQRNCVPGSQAIGTGQPGEDSVGFGQRMSGKHKLFAHALASFKLRQGPRMVFVPRTDRRDESAGIAEVSSHSPSSRSLADEALARMSLVVFSTSAAVKTGRSPRGTATTVDPRGSSVTSSGTGSITIRPARTRNRTRVPGRSRLASRTALGTTRRPALSMVVSMVGIMVFSVPSGKHGQWGPVRALAHPARRESSNHRIRFRRRGTPTRRWRGMLTRRWPARWTPPRAGRRRTPNLRRVADGVQVYVASAVVPRGQRVGPAST